MSLKQYDAIIIGRGHNGRPVAAAHFLHPAFSGIEKSMRL